MLVYKDSERTYKESASDLKIVDFGEGIGLREVVRLNLIECESCAASGSSATVVLYCLSSLI